jgi:hypothetical protein
MTERIDIANQALLWLGEDVITSLEDDSVRANTMKVNYIPSRDATLEAHEWSFAIERFIPGQLAEDAVFGGLHRFTVPPEILRVLTVDREWTTPAPSTWSKIGAREQLDWVFEDQHILCKEEVIYCRGIRRIEQEGKFSPLFVHAFAAKLAFLTALALTASAEIQGNMLALYVGFITEAKSRDGLQGRTKRLRSRWTYKSR